MAKKRTPPSGAPHLVVKDNRLMEAKFHFTLWEMRIFERMVSLVEKGDTEFRLCRIFIKDLMDFFHSKSNNDYELVRDAAKSLAYKKLHIPYLRDNRRRWAIISVFPTVTTPDASERDGDNAYIELEFHKDLRPYLLDLKERFKSYDIRNIQSLKSIYSIRLYILLKQYEGIGHRRFAVDDLKEILAIPSHQYAHYGSFKQRVILRPQEELAKHCDIHFEFEEEKEGKRVTAVCFRILSNPKNQYGPPVMAPAEEPEEAPMLDWPELSEQLPKFATISRWHDRLQGRVEVRQLEEWWRHYPEALLHDAVEYTAVRLEAGSISNAAGYLQKLLRDPGVLSSVVSVQEQASRKASAKAAKLQRQQEVAAVSGQYHELSQAYQDALERVLKRLWEREPARMQDLQDEGLKLARRVMAKATADGQMAQAQLMRLAKEAFPEAFAIDRARFEPELALLQQRLEQLR